MVTYDPTPTDMTAWEKVFAETRARLRGATFDAETFDEAVRLAQ